MHLLGTPEAFSAAFRARWGIGGDVRPLSKFKRTASPSASAHAATQDTTKCRAIRLRMRIACAVFFLASGCLTAALAVRAQQELTDSQVKAAYLYNFLKFIDWPDDPPKDGQSPWVLGVVGDTPVGDDLKQLVSGKSIRGREMEVKNYPLSGDFRRCNILFIGASEKKHLPSILASLHGFSVLTVADMDHFVESGGMIQFVIQDSRVRLAIDVGATNRAGLKVSSKLLSLALEVTGNDGSAKN
jgi:YfiR/HmsC-like